MIRFRDVIARLPLDGGARHALRSFNLAPKGSNEVPSVKALAEKLGFEVDRVDLPNGTTGRLVQDSFAENGYRIEVNKKLSVLQQRWAALHEIGHFFLHVDRQDPFALTKFRDRRDHFYMQDELKEEREADEFAAAVLFDYGALRAARDLFADDDARLSRHFGVTESVIRIAKKQF